MQGDELLTINQRVRMLRHRLKLPQIGFSKIIAVSPAQLACIETERRRVNDRTVKLVCDSFKVNEDWLRTGRGEMFAPERDEKFTRFIALFENLKPRYQDFILNAIDQFIQMQEDEAAPAGAIAGAPAGAPAAAPADASAGAPPGGGTAPPGNAPVLPGAAWDDAPRAAADAPACVAS